MTLAAARLQTPKTELTVRDGVVHAAKRSISYWDAVAGLNLNAEIAGGAQPKAATQHNYVGKPVPRIDIPRKIFGQEIFIQDLRLPGMVHGRPVRPPCHHATLVSVDEKPVAALPGVLKIVRDGSFLGVIASDEYTAVQASEKLAQTAKWSVKDGSDLNEAKLPDWLLKTKSSQTEILNKGNLLPRAIAGTVRRTYHRPYLMHGSIGTSTAIATATAGGHFTIQTHSQSVFDTGAAVARMLGVDPSHIHCEHHQGSGCYGHNAADDVVADAALLARAFPGRPVRVQ